MKYKTEKYKFINSRTLKIVLCFTIAFSCVFFSSCEKRTGVDELESLVDELNGLVDDLNEIIEESNESDNVEEDKQINEFFVPVPTYNAITEQKMESYEYAVLYDFVENKMMDNYAVHTHYLPSKTKKDYATGYDVLSESQGLLMDYALNVKDEQVFKGAFEFVEYNMLTDMGIGFRYAQDGSLDLVNAAIDDLRIIGALLRSKDVFDDRYYDAAVEYSRSFLETNIDNGYVVDYFSQKNKVKGEFVTICYADLDTLKKLSDIDEEYEDIYKNMLGIIENGYLGDDLPLYQTRYNYKKKRYETDRINMVECVLTMTHLAEIGRVETKSVEYIKQLVDEGVVYSTYAPNGTINTDEESTAVYGLIALLAKTIGDKQLYDSSIKLMQQLQVMDETIEVFGGHADANTLQAFSFDNLMALLAYSEGYTYE